MTWTDQNQIALRSKNYILSGKPGRVVYYETFEWGYIYTECHYQWYEDASDTPLIGSKGDTVEQGCNPFWNDSIVQWNESRIVIAEHWYWHSV